MVVAWPPGASGSDHKTRTTIQLDHQSIVTGDNEEGSLVINKDSIEREMFTSLIYKAPVELEDYNDNT
jgi:hypothetical protein